MAQVPGGKRRKTRAAVPGLENHRGKFRWRPMVDGKRLTIPLVASDLPGAIAEVLELKKRPMLKAAGSWDEAVEAYLRAGRGAGRLGETTVANRRTELLAIGRDQALAGPRSLTPPLVERWLAKQRGTVSEGSLRDYLAHLRVFCRWCATTGRMTADPTEGIELAPVETVWRDVFLEPWQLAGLLQAAKEAGDRDLEFILALGCECGMRRGEIAACRAEWFDLERGTVTVPASDRKGDGAAWMRKGRTGRRRAATIPLSATMRELIERHGLPKPYVIAPRKEWGKNRYRFEFKKRFEGFMQEQGPKLGFQHVTVHDLRRSFASNKVSAGVSIEKVANWMGIHRDTAWRRYSRFIPADEEIEKGTARAAAKEEAAAAAPARGIVERLKQLEELHAAGLISEEERAAKRAEILAGI